MSEIAPTPESQVAPEEPEESQNLADLEIPDGEDLSDMFEGEFETPDDDSTPEVPETEPAAASAAPESPESPESLESQPPTSVEPPTDSADASQAPDASASQTDTPPTPPQDGPPSVQQILQNLGLLPEGITAPAEGQVPQQPVAPQGPQVQQQPVQQQLLGMSPVTVPGQQQVPQQFQQPVEQQPSVQQPQQLDYQAVRNQQIEELANNQYNFDSETVEALTAEGSEQMATLAPRLAARVFMDAVHATTLQIGQVLPTMIDQHFQMADRSKKYEDAFYNFWDSRGFDLREYDQDLQSLGRSYRQVNPQGTPEEFITQVGAQVILAKQLRPAGDIGQPQTQPSVAQPFQSASVTPGVAPGTPQLNPMEQFFSDVLNEDADF